MDDASEKPVMIKVSGLKKKYRLGKIGAGTLQGAIKERSESRKGRGEQGRVGRKAGEFYALDGIDLVVHRGETLGIIGKNGAGKSTLLKILSQITAPTEGVVDLYGRVSSMLEVGTGFHGDMTGRENIYLNGVILGMSRAEVDLDRGSPTFTIEDRAELELRCTATTRLERIGFRFELWYQDGQLVGSMLCHEFADLDEGEHVLRIGVSFAHLAPGQYRADLVAFQFNEHGGEQLLDAVYPAYLFQIEPVLDEANYLVWKTNYWGVTRLEDIELRVLRG